MIKNIGIKEIVSYVGLLLLGLIAYCSTIHLWKGNVAFTLASVLVILLIGFVLVTILAFWKSAERDVALKKKAEVVVLVIGYGAFLTGTFLLFRHCWVIEVQNRGEIVNEGREGVQAIRGLFDDYEKNYIPRVSSTLATRINTCVSMPRLSGCRQFLRDTAKISTPYPPDISDIHTSTLKAKLTKGKDYQNVKNYALKYTIEAEGAYTGFQRRKLSYYHKDMPMKFDTIMKQLEIVSGYHYWTEDRRYEANGTSPEMTVPLTGILTLPEGVNYILLIPLFLFFHGMILLPYLLTERSRYVPPRGTNR